MSDLRTRIEQLGGPIEAASEDAIVADIARGRRAVRRRRTVTAAAGSAFGVAAIVAAVSLAGTGTGPGAGPAAAPVPAVVTNAAGNLKLVAYRGDQSRWFTIDKVPEGFFIQHDYYGGLTLAPEKARNRPAGIKPSTPAGELYDPQILTGKIGIYLELEEYRGELSGETLTVAGKQAILHPLEGGTQQLIIAVTSQVYATIQVDVPLSREQILELGAGLHVHQDAVDRMAAAAGVVPEKIKK
ncbi:hypothetical protein [Actinoplanes friuliensis]|jgi:hypothetical protein|uniref:Uncharacterized protein n=1 Tax=Actinoplanes friuliensis DSM 7358 TaxID=1246995 RepID=U5VWD2_9ACTN|nr:hypothetical protein [Actinoplanes friuliensis]AGZ41164.1 hypothetical protein AFR_14410 [Actinoplanes friuliensis DSM 7358]